MPQPVPLRSLALAGVIGGAVAAGAVGVAVAAGAGDDGDTRAAAVAAPVAAAPSALSRDLDAEAIYAREAPGVAFIRSYGVTTPTPFGPQQGVSEGSGFAVDGHGDVLTNAHVVDGAQRITVRIGPGTGRTVSARVVGKDESHDLAVLRVDPAKVQLDALPLGDSNTVRVGDQVLAIGNPFGLDRTITAGIVSALQRRIPAPDGAAIDHVIQTDAAINPGNSGGPLLDRAGRVIGINSQIATGQDGGDSNVGIGFAIPIDTAKAELPALERA
ncbi:MAG TPA: trypsin-like peptidase domain-containing protein [Solirubrobacteraceae bacterium]|jgi:putative serine protease PepD